MGCAVSAGMGISGRLLPLVTAAILAAGPLGLLAHVACPEASHVCGRTAAGAGGCCCEVTGARGNDPTTAQMVPAVPPVFLPVPGRAEAAPAMPATLRVPHYAPFAGHVPLITLFVTLLI